MSRTKNYWLYVRHTFNNLQYQLVISYFFFCRHRIQVELDTNTKLELTVAKLENHIKELENKIEIFKAKELHQINDNLVEVILLISCKL